MLNNSGHLGDRSSGRGVNGGALRPCHGDHHHRGAAHEGPVNRDVLAASGAGFVAFCGPRSDFVREEAGIRRAVVASGR